MVIANGGELRGTRMRLAAAVIGAQALLAGTGRSADDKSPARNVRITRHDFTIDLGDPPGDPRRCGSG
jgi:hypothetical protein